MVKKNILICIDRDGTIDYDRKYHLGHQKDWKDKIRILPRVAHGIRLLNNKLPRAKIYIMTNQPGVAITDFPLLTMDRANDVCRFVITRLKKMGAIVNGFFVCGKASVGYTKRKHGFKFDKKLVGDFSCIKPKPGMVYDALKELGWKKSDTEIYFIGDKLGDVKAGLNAGGYGVYVSFIEMKDDQDKVKELKKGKNSSKVYVADDFLDAVNFIIKKK